MVETHTRSYTEGLYRGPKLLPSSKAHESADISLTLWQPLEALWGVSNILRSKKTANVLHYSGRVYYNYKKQAYQRESSSLA